MGATSVGGVMRRGILVAATVLLGPLPGGSPGADPSAGPTPGPPQAVTEGGSQGRVYTYPIATRGAITANPDPLPLHVAQTLGDPRGWSLGGSLEFRQVSS